MSSSATRPTLSQSVALVWRTLRSMRTALILLLLLALAAVAGSLIPQIPANSARVALYMRQHPFWGEFYLRAGLFDVFGSWWFVLITTLLFVSLVACLVPRTRATWRAVRQKPIQARELDSFRHYEERTVADDARRRDRGLPPRPAPPPLPGRARRGVPGPRGGKGRGPRGGEPAVPLGVHPAVGGCHLRQGHRLHGTRS